MRPSCRVSLRLSSWRICERHLDASFSTSLTAFPRSGHVSVWSRNSYTLKVIQTFSKRVTTVLGVFRYLWIGLASSVAQSAGPGRPR